MAKNLKKIEMIVKNKQLQNALESAQIKKRPPAAKPPKVVEPAAPNPMIEEVKAVAPEPIAPPPQKVETPPPPPPEPVAPPAMKAEPASPPPQRIVPQNSRPPYSPSYPQNRYPTSGRPPYRGPGEPSSMRPYPQSGPRPPYQGGQRPPYPPRPPGAGPRPYSPGGPRPPYQGSPRPPYQGSSRPPFAQGGFNNRGAPPTLPPKEGVRGPDAFIKKPFREGAGNDAPGFKRYQDVRPVRKETDSKAFDSRDRQGLRADIDEQGWHRRRRKTKQGTFQEEVIRPKELKVRIPIMIKDLAAEMKLKASQLIAKLLMKGVLLTLNDFLDDETTIQLLGHDFDCSITIDTSEADRVQITDKTIKQEISETPSDSLILRPPVAAFMGHVDHGKTSLIDAIRKSNVAATESGAITQHIGAFQCHTPVGNLTILDTPGHEAFSAMRSRGADVTDIVVLVIAGDEGIRTQTIEAMEQAKAAGCPILVAINKSDKPNFNTDTVYRQLAENNLLPESWGGATITVNCSALTGEGIPQLLEMLALQAEILELKANPNTRARGTVVEAQMQKGMGAEATVLVQNGTLRLGDSLVFAQHFAKVKTMQDENGKSVTQAPPSAPVRITGLSGFPEAGSEFIVVSNEKEAREVAEKRSENKRISSQQIKRANLETLKETPKKTLNLIIRADVQGSVEALKASLQKIETTKVELNFIATGVGEISESDIQLAAASKATILGFHTKIESHADSLIKQLKVAVKLHDIIYHAVDDVKAIMLSLLDKIAQETDTGTAEVRAIFKSSQLGLIAGCQVIEGTIQRSNQVRVLRGKEVVWKGAIASLKKGKEDTKEVAKGQECGILLQRFSDNRVGDLLQAYEITYLQQEL